MPGLWPSARPSTASDQSMFTMTENVAPQYTSPTKWERSARSAGEGACAVKAVKHDWMHPLPHRCRDATSPTLWARVIFPVGPKML